jgi:malonate-semialdehyde dehydrogenase (acetylating) / methylmalonate-semialdehyde dehydrogenase
MTALPSTPWFLIGGEHAPVTAAGGRTLETLPVLDPSTGAELGAVHLANTALVDTAVAAATAALPAWRALPATKRSRLLLRLAALLGENAGDLAATISRDNGKAVADARAELARSIEHLEAAASAPALLAGEAVVDILPGVDSELIREAIGVCAIVSPFNFPIMTGLIYWAWALACGNTIIIKPSEQAPYAASALGALVIEAGFAPGVVNIVHGAREAVEALCDHPGIASVSLVGSSATARAVYARATAAGKRAHAAGGARNPLVVMPDADLPATADAITASAFAMAGQRCLSGSLLVVVGDVHDELVALVAERARALVVAAGDDPASQVPPIISRAAVNSAAATVERAVAAGATALLDGRTDIRPDGGYFFGPTILTGVDVASDLATEETFGPLLSVLRVDSLDEALAFVNGSPFGNAASIFTRSGGDARRFRSQADVGNVGINIGVAAPTAHVGFGGRRRSFLGTVHSQAKHAIEFYTDIKSVSVKWS